VVNKIRFAFAGPTDVCTYDAFGISLRRENARPRPDAGNEVGEKESVRKIR